MPKAVLSLFAFVLGCASLGGSPPPSSQRALPDYDWALLLPLEADGLVRLDLARLRRSPHRAAIEPLLAHLLGELADPSLEPAFSFLLERTDVALVALSPKVEGQRRELVLLARGAYAEDELDRMERPEGARAARVEGIRVWVGAMPGEPTAIARLRPDVVAMTGSLESMRALVARTRMTPSSPRWPPALRPLVEGTGLEQATIGVAFANRSLGDGESGLHMSVAGSADLDAALDLELMAELDDPALAQLGAAIFVALIEAVARSGMQTAPGARHIADLVRIETTGTRVRGTLHAERDEVYRLLPAILAMVTEDLAPQPPPLFDPYAPRPVSYP
jgi:hypothetical protein